MWLSALVFNILPSMDDISPSMDGIFSCQVFGKNCLHHTLNEFVSIASGHSTLIDLTRITAMPIRDGTLSK